MRDEGRILINHDYQCTQQIISSRSWKTVLKFVVNISVCYLVAYGVAKPAVSWLLADASTSIQENGAMLVGMGLFVILNYFGQRFFAFKKGE